MGPRRSSPCRRLALVRVLLACGLLSACFDANRVPVRGRGPARAAFQAATLDMSFLELPAVQQKDVADKLASIDTGYHDPHLFWGRWADSRAKVKNLLVTFDDNGGMQKCEVIDDDRAPFAAHARARDNYAPATRLSQPEFLSVNLPNALPILLHREYFEVTAGKKKGPLRIAPTSVLRLTHDSNRDKRNNAGTTCHTLHLAEKTSAGRSIRYCASAEKVVTLFRYLQGTGAKTMQWE